MSRWSRTLCCLLLLCLGIGAPLRVLATSWPGDLRNTADTAAASVHCHPMALAGEVASDAGSCLPEAGCGHCGACVFGAVLLPSLGGIEVRPAGHAPWEGAGPWRARTRAMAVPTPPPR